MFFQIRSIAAVFCGLAMILAMTPVSQIAYAQDTITGEVTGVSVSISGGWSHDPIASLSSASVDSLVFSNGNAQFVVSGGSTDIDETFSMLAVSHSVSDIDVADSYALRGVDADGTPFGVFQVAVGNNVQTLIAPVSSFADAVGEAQAGIQIDGAAVLNGVDGTALASSIANTMGSGNSTGDASASPLLGSETPGDDAAEEVTGDDLTATADEEATTAETEESSVEDEATEASDISSESGETGFVDTNTFVSPQFGSTVTWDESWVPSIGENGDPLFNSMVSEFGSYDSFCLNSVQTDPQLFVCIAFEMPNEYTSDRFASYAVPGNHASNGIPHFGLAASDSAVTFTATNIDGDAQVTQEVISNGVVVSMRQSGNIETIADAVEAAQNGITIDGEPAYSLLDLTTYRAEMDSMAAALPEMAAERDETLTAMGLHTPTHYTSAAYGCDVAWSNDHYLDMTNMSPIESYEDWDALTDATINVENFWLSALDEPYVSFAIECYENLSSVESWWRWTAETDSEQIEGVQAYYLVRHDGSEHFITLITKPVGAPTLVIQFYASTETLTSIQNGEPGVLVLNGIDITEILQEDDLVSHLP